MAAARSPRLLAVAAALGLGAATACSIEPRSDAFVCQGPGDCDDGRVCQDGWCVAGVAPADASDEVPADAAGENDAAIADGGVSCPLECTECDEDGVCIIDCRNDDDCQEIVVCPAGIPCQVTCDGNNSCLGGVDCRQATACEVNCTDREACFGPIECGPGRCTVSCDARDTCASGVGCADSCACDVDCSGIQSCDVEPDCPDGCAVSGECVSTDDGCDVCDR